MRMSDLTCTRHTRSYTDRQVRGVVWTAMAEASRNDQNDNTVKKWTAQAAAKVLAALNRADELGGELRDYLQDRVATDQRYVTARKVVARLLGKTYESRAESAHKAQVKA